MKTTISKLSVYQLIALASAAISFVAFSSQANAQTIIHDNFTYASTNPAFDQNGPGSGPYGGISLSQNPSDPTDFPGLPTDTTSPVGAVWLGAGQADGYDSGEHAPDHAPYINYNSIYPVSYASARNGTGAAMTLGGTLATTLVYTATVAQAAEGSPSGNYSVFGFYSSLPGSNYAAAGDTNFTGLALGINGDLSLDINGTLTEAQAFTGTYTPGTLENLSFTVNTATGVISNVSLGGSSTVYTSFTTGGAIADNFAGFSSTGATDTYLSSFDVSSPAPPAPTPEPSTYALFVCGLVVLGAFQYRRSKQMVGV